MKPGGDKVRPLLRVAAVLVGLVWLAGGLSMIVFGSRWDFILMGLCGLAGSALFIYIGVTGANFYWEPESADGNGADSEQN